MSSKEEVTLGRFDWYSQLLRLGKMRHVVNRMRDLPQSMGVGDIQVEMGCSDIDIQCLVINRLKDHRVYSTSLDSGAQYEFETQATRPSTYIPLSPHSAYQV
jgi:hypothetical protein